MRPIFGLRRPKAWIPGTDMAGSVEAVGAGVTAFQPGDEVFGWGTGAFAEYATAPADSFSKPHSLTSEAPWRRPYRLHGHQPRSAGCDLDSTCSSTAASGGVGTFAVQIAKALGAEVTGVCSARNAKMIQSIGADHAIDYAVDDFTQGEARYDLILDNVGNHSFSDTRRTLTPDGTLLSNGAPVGGWFGGLGHVIVAMLQSMLHDSRAGHSSPSEPSSICVPSPSWSKPGRSHQSSTTRTRSARTERDRQCRGGAHQRNGGHHHELASSVTNGRVVVPGRVGRS